MPIGALKKTSTGQNGLSTFILPLLRLDLHYCDRGGSSRGMHKFLTHNLQAFARDNPSVEINVSPRPNKHPIVRGYYLNGREKVVCVRNLEKEQVLQKVELLRDSSGEKSKRVRNKVQSLNESVRGVWSPFHVKGAGGREWRI